MRAAVVFHSVVGNTCLVAKGYQAQLQSRGIETDLFRIPDPTFTQQGILYQGAFDEYRDELLSVPVMEHVHALGAYDLFFLGCPTYFGTMSSPMKLFLDEDFTKWTSDATPGKLFGCFTTLEDFSGGPETCLLSMMTWAAHRAMILLSNCKKLNGLGHSAFGLMFPTGADGTNRPTEKMMEDIGTYMDWVVPIAQKYYRED